ncbi:MAG: DUF4143 domain-containing protein [Candidatus Riflebacteria bacterium]|nr:DUF4143 domain-containing protein [Candidatus Riflebacteria bacterium]
MLFLDIGLGQHLAGVNPSEIMNSSNLNKTFDGRLAEQFVGQELLAESLLGKITNLIKFLKGVGKIHITFC